MTSFLGDHVSLSSPLEPNRISTTLNPLDLHRGGVCKQPWRRPIRAPDLNVTLLWRKSNKLQKKATRRIRQFIIVNVTSLRTGVYRYKLATFLVPVWHLAAVAMETRLWIHKGNKTKMTSEKQWRTNRKPQFPVDALLALIAKDQRTNWNESHFVATQYKRLSQQNGQHESATHPPLQHFLDWKVSTARKPNTNFQ